MTEFEQKQIKALEQIAKQLEALANQSLQTNDILQRVQASQAIIASKPR